MDYYIIGENIRKYRKQKALSQEELAERVGISVTHMSHIETGYTKLSLSVAVNLAHALDVQIDTLLNEADKNGIKAEEQIGKILSQCTEKQAEILIDVLKAVKDVLDKHK